MLYCKRMVYVAKESHMAAERRTRPDRVRVARRRRAPKKQTSLYKKFIILILVIGGAFLLNRFYVLWEIRGDMKNTVRQEEELSEENGRLLNEKEKLVDPDELRQRARKQFGLVKQGEIPYKQ